MNKNKIQDFIDESIQQNINGIKSYPRYYSVMGSRLYGFESEDSDFDIRGFHTIPADEYAYLDNPSKEIRIENNSSEKYKNYELVSYELKKYGQLLYSANYDVIEQLLCGKTVMNGVSLDIEALKNIVRNHLPLNVPESYYGMAKSQYHKHLDEDSDRYNPTPSAYLYVYRGLIAAKYVQNEQDIIANIQDLAKEVSIADENIVDKLIELKSKNIKQVDEDIRLQIDNEIIDLYSKIDIKKTGDKEEYRNDINSWMKSFRQT